jgi:hypothetical protein
LAAILARPVSAQPGVEVALHPKVATVGDRVVAVLTLPASATPAGDPRFPVWGKRWGGAEIVEAGAVQKESTPGGAVYRQRIVLTSFAVGPVSLPPVPLAVSAGAEKRTILTPGGLGFEVRSVLPAANDKEKEPEAKPAIAPRPLPLGAAFWWTAGGSALALALVLFALRRRLRTKASGEEARPALAPFEELVAELAGVGPGTSALEAHTRISHALRRYLARRLPFPALESTTSEIQRQLAARRMPAAIAARTVELLRACDLVKFARWPVDAGELRGRLTAARDLAQDFERHFAPPAPAPREAA